MSGSSSQRRTGRNRQSRLVFDAVEPGARAPMSPAKLRYENPNAKNPKKIRTMTSTLDDSNAAEDVSADGSDVVTPSRRKKELGGKALPSPQKSSQLHTKGSNIAKRPDYNPNDDDSDSDIKITSSRRIDAHVKGVGKRETFQFKKPTRKSKAMNNSSDSSQGSEPEQEEEEEEQQLPPQRSQEKKVVVDHDRDYDDDEEESEQSPEESTSRAKGRRQSQVTTPVKARSFLSGGSSYNAPIASNGRRILSSSKSRGIRKFNQAHTTPSKSKAVESIDSTSDEDELQIVMPTPKATQAANQKSKQPPGSAIGSRSQQRNAIDVDDEDESGDSDENLPSLSQLKKKTPEMSKLSLLVTDELEDEDDDDDDVVSSPMKRKRAARKNFSSDEDEDNDIVSSPSKRKRVAVEDSDDSDDLQIIPNPPKNGKQKASESDDGSDYDTAFLSPQKKQKTHRGSNSRSGKSQGRITRQQQSKKPKRTPGQKQLELLRRKRAGEKIDQLTDSDAEEQGAALYDSASELEVLSTFEDESEDENIKVKKGTHKNKKKKDEDEDEGDDFIVDDDDEEVGVPGLGLNDIPLEFTHAAHKSKREHFKDAVEWLVQRKINPAFNRDDPVYRVAFQKLDDALRGHASSNYTSSTWREGFIRALYARPSFHEEYITGDLDDDLENNKCDACNRSKHPARFMISFRGKAYYRDSLEDVDNDPDSDVEGDHQDYNENGERIPDEDQVYRVGSFCKANAEKAHSLIHWKFALNEWVLDELKAAGHLSPENLAAREELNTKKRSKIAEGIVDEWEASKKIKELYSSLKATLDDATHGQRNNRWGR